jgi:hypothetical protein
MGDENGDAKSCVDSRFIVIHNMAQAKMLVVYYAENCRYDTGSQTKTSSEESFPKGKTSVRADLNEG